ncbi:MAG TPA: response regulator [Ktedonobacteraceae bacterium]|nr:response regulator [Ktedonobacteraceae bacterium]
MQKKPRKILVVDDEPVIRDMMADILEVEGYTVEVTRNGREALEKLSRSDNYLVFLDLLMPVMDGRELCQQLNARPEVRMQHVVVIMSALDQLAQVSSLHIDETMPKPFVVDDVLRIIQSYMPE